MWHRVKDKTQEINSNILRYNMEAKFALAQCNMTSRAALLPDIRPLTSTIYIVAPVYPQVTCSKTYRGYEKPRIIPNAIHNVIFV
jgi:hypothetical protein